MWRRLKCNHVVVGVDVRMEGGGGGSGFGAFGDIDGVGWGGRKTAA